MKDDSFARVRQEIRDHESNRQYLKQGYEPLFTASADAQIVIIGQAPGIKAQTSGIPWNDASGQKLIQWLGITEAQFRDEKLVSLLPMDFYYPGKGVSGDLPPRKTFAPLWHTRLLAMMPNVELILLIGSYAQQYYLRNRRRKTLTETVHNYEDYLPEYFPLVHPSPLNFRWQSKNPWFTAEVVPALQRRVKAIIE